ncbi:MAG: HDOD domain-containing protein [Candidatus Lindowbacteria bacterium]|nr:HDOD domain-containing protein [Candidatus Lindowbacteria bacterium]
MSRKEEILAKISSISSMPPAAAEAARLLQDPESNIKELVRAIEYDPGMASNILRMANSAYYGFSESVGSVKDAIVRLGTNCIFQMVASFSFSPLAQQHVPGYGLASGKLWEHSIAVAVGAEQLAMALKLKSPAHAFTAGLLHDIGKVLLGRFVEVDIASIMGVVSGEKVSFEVAEQRVLGIDHAEAGAVLLETWNLPPSVASVSRWHHQPEWFSGEMLLIDLVHVVDTMCLMGGIGTGIDAAYYHTSAEVAERLRLDAVITDRIISKILSRLDEARGLFAAKKEGKGERQKAKAKI